MKRSVRPLTEPDWTATVADDMGRMRFVNLSAGFWALVAVPLLCTGGILTHACDEPRPSPCHVDDDHQELPGCGHESDCSSDPCKIVGLRSGDRNDEQQNLASGDIQRTACLLSVDWFIPTPILALPPPALTTPFIGVSHAVLTAVLLI